MPARSEPDAHPFFPPAKLSRDARLAGTTKNLWLRMGNQNANRGRSRLLVITTTSEPCTEFGCGSIGFRQNGDQNYAGRGPQIVTLSKFYG